VSARSSPRRWPLTVTLRLLITLGILVGAVCTSLIHGPRLAAIIPGTLLAMLAGLAWLEPPVNRASR
jgi:hypothetical protein